MIDKFRVHTSTMSNRASAPPMARRTLDRMVTESASLQSCRMSRITHTSPSFATGSVSAHRHHPVPHQQHDRNAFKIKTESTRSAKLVGHYLAESIFIKIALFGSAQDSFTMPTLSLLPNVPV